MHCASAFFTILATDGYRAAFTTAATLTAMTMAAGALLCVGLSRRARTKPG